MTRHEDFAADLDAGAVRVMLDLPEETNGARPATVVVCHGLPALNPETEKLLEEIRGALAEAGVAVATFGEASETAGGGQSIDDASAVIHAMAVRDDLDINRIGVLGYSLGGIIASCLARRTDQIARLCLLAPVTTDEIAAGLINGNENDLASRLGGTEVPSGFFDDLTSLTPTEDLVVHDRPTLILHGAADRTVPPDVSLKYRDAIQSAGRQVEHALVALADHTFTDEAARSACLHELGRFFSAPGQPEPP